MGDIAQILGDTGQGAPNAPPASHAPSKAMRITGISRDVMQLLGGNQDPKSAALPPIVPSFTKNTTASTTETGGTEVKVKVGNKWISSSKQARQWTWAPFASSSRTDGAMFRHWVRANVEYTDYPYAKFDIHLDPVTYSDEEYATYLKSDSWTKSETDKLLELARRYELRWALIHDRWLGYYHAEEDNSSSATRNLEDLQHRYYSVAAILSQIRISKEAAAEAQALSAAVPDPTEADVKEKTERLLLETAAARALATAAPQNQPLISNVGTGSSNKLFDVVRERERRAHLDRLWKRSKEEEVEEMELRKELKLVDAQLRKLKKTGGHILAATHGGAPGASAPSRLSSAASSRNPSRSVSPVPGGSFVDNPGVLDQSFASTAPTAMPQNPYLQAGRLVPPATGGSLGLNKTLLTKMDQVLKELKIPTRPLPTKRVCDLYDSVRKDVLTLVTLQKLLLQREGNLQAKRVKLSKLGGGEMRMLDEEALLGIKPPPPPPAPTTAPKSTKAARPTKSKATTGTTSKSKSSAASKTKPTDEAGKSDNKDSTIKKPKPAVKRKRKPETAKPPAAAAAPAAPGAVPAAPPVSSTAVAPATIKTPVTKAAVASDATGSEGKQSGGKKRARKT
jgi:DNA methyltransferase 1-associated protein 1